MSMVELLVTDTLKMHRQVLHDGKQTNPMLYCFCAPIKDLKVKDSLEESRFTDESREKSLIIEPIFDIWRSFVCKFCTVASCTSTRCSEQEINNLDSHSTQNEKFNNIQALDRLPGVQINKSDRTSRKRNTALNELQVNHLIQQETGIDRLRIMYQLGPDWMFFQEDTRTITTIFYRSVVLGFFLNAIKAAQTETKKSKHSSPSEAIMKMGLNNHLSDSTRVFKEAAKKSVKLTGFAACLLYLSQSIAAYRNESSIWEYSISASLAMAIAGLGKPPKAFAIGIVGGTVVGSLAGALICSMMSSVGATQEQRTLNRIRYKLELQQQHEVEEGVVS